MKRYFCHFCGKVEKVWPETENMLHRHHEVSGTRVHSFLTVLVVVEDDRVLAKLMKLYESRKEAKLSEHNRGELAPDSGDVGV